MKTIKPFSGTRYLDNSDRCTKHDHACVLCGKPITDTKSALSATVVEGGDSFVLVGGTADMSAPGYMGAFYAGPTCAKKLRAANVKLT